MRRVLLALSVVLAGCSKPAPTDPGRAMAEANFARQQQNIDELRKQGKGEMADEMQRVLDDARRMDQALSKH